SHSSGFRRSDLSEKSVAVASSAPDSGKDVAPIRRLAPKPQHQGGSMPPIKPRCAEPVLTSKSLDSVVKTAPEIEFETENLIDKLATWSDRVRLKLKTLVRAGSNRRGVGPLFGPVPITGRLSLSKPASACSTVVFPVPFSPRIIVHAAGFAFPSDRSSVCFGPKQRTFSTVSDKKYAAGRSAPFRSPETAPFGLRFPVVFFGVAISVQ